jgi:hypothetical protein
MGDVDAAEAESKALDNTASEATKRTYTPPSLSSYGTLRDITLHVGDSGSRDNVSKKRTHK